MSQMNKTIKMGFIEALPLAIAIATYGLSYGVLAVQADFNLQSTVTMSLLVFSGSVQLVTVAMVETGAGLTSILITAILLNSRNLLYGAVLAEGLAPAKKGWRWLLSFGVSDEPFVLASNRFRKYGPDPLYFGVVTGTFYIAWVFSSYAGAVIGNQIDPLQWGLDLAFPIAFAAMLVPSLSGKPIIATAVTAIILSSFLVVLLPRNELNIIITGVLSPLIGLYVGKKGKDND